MNDVYLGHSLCKCVGRVGSHGGLLNYGPLVGTLMVRGRTVIGRHHTRKK